MQVAIRDVIVAERRREDYGDIVALSRAIAREGLLHPIILTDANVLVAGERRLRACAALGWETIEAKQVGELTETELRHLELSENVNRKDLLPIERNKFREQVVEATKAEAVADASSNFCSTVEQKFDDATPRRRGRPSGSRKPGSVRDVKARTGISEATQSRAPKHVAAVSRYPFMARWSMKQALDGAGILDSMAEDRRAYAVTEISRVDMKDGAAVAFMRRVAVGTVLGQHGLNGAGAVSESRASAGDKRIPNVRKALSAVLMVARMDDDDIADELRAIAARIEEVLRRLEG
jgi:hypothetical protein